MSEDRAIDPLERRLLMALAIGFEGGLLLVGVILAWIWDTPFWQTLTLTTSALVLGVGFALVMGLVAAGLMHLPLRAFRQIQKDFEAVIVLFRNATVSDLALISLLAGCGEEMLFRGALQPFMTRYTGEIGAILVVSVLFGLVHTISRSYFVFTTLIGVFLGWLYAWTDNLLAPITVHAFYDFLALLYGIKSAERRQPQDSPD